MKNLILNASIRDKVGVRGNLRNLRNSGQVPAVIYGAGKENVSIYVNIKEVSKIIKEAGNSIITVKYGDKEEKVIIKDIQKHVVTDLITHIDFNRVVMDKKIDIKVPLKFVGESYGVKVQGGVIEYDIREITVRCLPENIPHEISIDITSLKIGDAIRIKDIKADNFEIRENPNNIVVSVISAKEEEVAQPQATVEQQQPEVISKGKKEKEGTSAKDGAKEQPKEAGKK